jgi:hypothetical protein
MPAPDGVFQHSVTFQIPVRPHLPGAVAAGGILHWLSTAYVGPLHIETIISPHVGRLFGYSIPQSARATKLKMNVIISDWNKQHQFEPISVVAKVIPTLPPMYFAIGKRDLRAHFDFDHSRSPPSLVLMARDHALCSPHAP